MRTFTLLAAVLSYVAVIGATPLGARAPAEAIDRRQGPNCEEYPEDPACLPCNINPYQTGCTPLDPCVTDPESCESPAPSG